MSEESQATPKPPGIPESGTGFWNKQGVRLNYWKLAIWKLVSGVQIVAISTLIPILSTQNWRDLDMQARLLVILGVWLAVLKFIEGFLDQTMGRLREGQKTKQGP